MEEVTLYHNPDCGTSRNVLALLRHGRLTPRVIAYLKDPPSREDLQRLIAASGLSVRDVARKKGTPYAELGLGDASVSDDAILDAMMAHPILINRPLVETAKGVMLCRPSDVALDLLPSRPEKDLLKEDGVPFLRDHALPSDDPALEAALQDSHLATDDLRDPGRHVFAFRTLSGTPVGYGGFEMHDEEALLRSIVVDPAYRGRGIGRNLVALLSYRAARMGARRAWLFTTDGAGFFARIGFKPVARETAPAAILATRQGTGLCPGSASLFTRSLGF